MNIDGVGAYLDNGDFNVIRFGGGLRLVLRKN